VNDGAAAMVVLSEAAASKYSVKPQAEVVAYATSGLDPAWVMMAPVEAVEAVLKKTGWKREEVDLYELNEAFSVQAVAVIRELKLPPERVNVRGGAVALGHPIGASGARILTTLIHALADQGGRKGIAALCLGGGNAVALAVKMI
jgi:acetyl-CoA C-acetyltransferase